MIQPFMWRSKSPSVPCLAPAPCTSSPSKHEGQRERATTAKDPAFLGGVEGTEGEGVGVLCVSIQRIARVVKVPRDLGSVIQSNVTENGAQQINRV